MRSEVQAAGAEPTSHTKDVRQGDTLQSHPAAGREPGKRADE